MLFLGNIRTYIVMFKVAQLVERLSFMQKVKDMGSNLTLVTFFSRFFLIANTLKPEILAGT